MMDLTIKEIAEACGGQLTIQGGRADCDSFVSSVVIDSRKVEARGVFVATVGERVDGHRFISDTYQRGAILAVTQKRPEDMEEAGEEPWGSYILVEDTLKALKDIAEFYRRKLSAKIIGITGSVGKTSTKEFIAGVLAEKFRVLKTEGNFNNEIGVPLTLLRIRREHELAVVEMGISDFGEMRRLSKMVRPNVCVITNIGQSHLNNLKDRDGILRAKSEIFDYMSADGEICLNGEDDKLNGLEEIKGHKPHFFGLGSSSSQEVAAVDIVGRGLWGSDATLMMVPGRTAWNSIKPGEDTGAIGAQPEKTPGMGGTKLANTADINNAETDGTAKEAVWPGYHRLPVHVSQPGRHMVLNAAAAACVARLFGLTGEQIAAGIAKVSAVDGRTHIISHPRYTIIDDCYNANPASVKAALDLLALADTRKVAILGDMLNLGENSHDYHAQIGTYAAEAGIDTILCVGEEARYMYQAAAEWEKAEQAKANQASPPLCRILHYLHRGALLEALAADSAFLIPKGSTILVKASHDCGFSEILAFLQAMG
ncbi:MAG: UDP-N-acetylmuramoyl-tripeptide--D-alanyl-D-alanine ligase [Lachnospiraceae bacterium]|nr:UDP-N-acetylmuramoyl-tripeptide--D-alanyl-D-alanine ligase [Lachnospiraceae bacterium]